MFRFVISDSDEEIALKETVKRHESRLAKLETAVEGLSEKLEDLRRHATLAMSIVR